VLRLALADAARRLAAEYIKAAGSLAAPLPPQAQDGLRAAVRRIIHALATGFVSELPALVSRLAEITDGGLRLGAQVPGRPRRLRLKASRELEAANAKLRKTLRDQAAAARKLADTGPLRRYSDVTAMVAKAQQAVNQVESTARWVANRAVNEGARATAEAADAPVLWLAERDACLTCLAYAGHLAEPGQPFPAGLSFGDSSTVTDPIDGPPAHPNCRCRLQPWFGTEPQFGIQLPQALQREAQRSVLMGASDYASRLAKLRAADRLLKTSLSGLSDTVKIRARRAVRAGPTSFKPAVRARRAPDRS